MISDPLERSDRNLQAARVLLEHGFHEEVFPLAFHAGENAVREVLSAMGLTSKTHASTLREFGRLLIERGLDKQAGAALNRLLRGRQDVTYGWGEVSGEDAERAVEDARVVIEAARALLATVSPKERE